MVDGKFYKFDVDNTTYVGKYELESENFFVGKSFSYSSHESWFYLNDCKNIIQVEDPYLLTDLGFTDDSDQGTSQISLMHPDKKPYIFYISALDSPDDDYLRLPMHKEKCFLISIQETEKSDKNFSEIFEILETSDFNEYKNWILNHIKTFNSL